MFRRRQKVRTLSREWGFYTYSEGRLSSLSRRIVTRIWIELVRVYGMHRKDILRDAR